MSERARGGRALPVSGERRSAEGGSPSGRFRVLFVCTANQCRSPLAEAIARREAGALPIDFASAGLMAGGVPTPPRGLRVAHKIGLDLDDHLSRQVSAADLPRYDVVLTMTREHARRLVVIDPEVWPTVFTLKQFSRWLAEHPRPLSAALGPWLSVTARDRQRGELIGSNPAEDIVDPIASSSRVWREVSTDLTEHIRAILSDLYPA